MKSKDQILLEAAYQQINEMNNELNKEQHRVLSIFKSKAIKATQTGPKDFDFIFPNSVLFELTFVGENELVLGFYGSQDEGQLQTSYPSLNQFDERQLVNLLDQAGPNPKIDSRAVSTKRIKQ